MLIYLFKLKKLKYKSGRACEQHLWQEVLSLLSKSYDIRGLGDVRRDNEMPD